MWGERLLPFCGLPVMIAEVPQAIERPSSIDHNSITIALFIIGIILTIMGVLIRGWFKHVNESLDKLWQHMDSEAVKREERWDCLHIQCHDHEGRISRIEGRMDINHRRKLPVREGD